MLFSFFLPAWFVSLTSSSL
jgi:4-hydroxy-2-oxoglutarate aldolase